MAPFYCRKDTLHLEGLCIDWMYRFRRLAPNAFHSLSRFGGVHEKHVTIMSRLFMAVTRTSNMCAVVAADTYYISHQYHDLLVVMHKDKTSKREGNQYKMKLLAPLGICMI
jgi:hypothetical protein